MHVRHCKTCGKVRAHTLVTRHEESGGKARHWQAIICRVCGEETAQEIKAVVFEFIGGIYDGQIEGAASSVMLKLLAQGGAIGERFLVGSVPQDHEYEVIQRIFDKGELLVRARYVGRVESQREPGAISTAIGHLLRGVRAICETVHDNSCNLQVPIRLRVSHVCHKIRGVWRLRFRPRAAWRLHFWNQRIPFTTRKRV
jgi:hypothetical protein